MHNLKVEILFYLVVLEDLSQLHMDITRQSKLKSNGLYSLQSNWRNSIQSTKIRLGADCGSDHELLTAKFRLNGRK